jgi:hypothetical protein
VVTDYQRRTRRWCGRDAEVASFYSRALHGGDVGLRKEAEREVTLDAVAERRECMRALRCDSLALDRGGACMQAADRSEAASGLT